MLEITNRTKSPIQLLLKSKKGAFNKQTQTLLETNRAFKSFNLPGLGSGKNVLMIEDEKATDQLLKLERDKLITIRRVN